MIIADARVGAGWDLRRSRQPIAARVCEVGVNGIDFAGEYETDTSHGGKKALCNTYILINI